MQFGFRWFGSTDDPIPLGYIHQIPGVTQVVGALFDIGVGEVWPTERIATLRREVTDAGLQLEVVESVNIHDDIKTGAPRRDEWIENYTQTIKNLATHGVKVICYNFMPVFDWVRTELRQPLPDGSHAMAYDANLLQDGFDGLVARMAAAATEYSLPGWEPERLADLRRLMAAYADIDETTLAENFRYFIQAIMPTCEQYDVRMAVHPDDPPWPLFGLPRIVKNVDDLRRIESFHDSVYNGFTLCTGSLGQNQDNDVPAMIREFVGRGKVPFAHVRNIKHTGPGTFHESAHPTSEGSLDMVAIMRALHDSGFDGYIRPDHGRDIWGEQGRPGYGLYDRALGIAYLTGIWETLTKA